MNVLIKDAKIIDSNSSWNGKIVSIRIKNGKIIEIAPALDILESEKVLDYKNAFVSPGWFDSSVSIGEPGYEERETLENALKVAAHTGFTGIAVNPNAHPIPDNSGSIAYLLNKSSAHPVDLYPIGALTTGSLGIDLAELFDMQNTGAVAFGDYQVPIANPNLLKLALQYAQGFDGLVLSFPIENQLMGKGMANEGPVATQLGLKGIPALAESLQVARDLYILEYTGGKLHIPTISTLESVQLIREAKAKGLNVSCSVAIANLFLTDELLNGFDTRYKVLPPLRDKEHQNALIEGLNDGTIDMVCSDHNPLDIELKKLEFDHAMFGTVAQEATLGALLQIVPVEKAIQLLTAGWKTFTKTTPTIAIGEKANLTLFTDSETYTFTKQDILSKSKNSAFLGTKLKGKVYGIINNNNKSISN